MGAGLWDSGFRICRGSNSDLVLGYLGSKPLPKTDGI